MKIIRFLLTILTILLLSISIAFAGIPGITKPFDPPNYYSPTSVSIPDSAPSPFALKDLAAQGYKVHDVINSKKRYYFYNKNIYRYATKHYTF